MTIASIITSKNQLKDLIIFNDFKSEIKKTKEMNLILNKFDSSNIPVLLLYTTPVLVILAVPISYYIYIKNSKILENFKN